MIYYSAGETRTKIFMHSKRNKNKLQEILFFEKIKNQKQNGILKYLKVKGITRFVGVKRVVFKSLVA